MLNPVSSQKAALKARELSWFKTAQALCSAFPRGDPEQPPPLAPDLRFPEFDLGIEITEYLGKQKGGSPLRALEMERAKILDQAKRLFARVSTARPFVSVSWNPGQKLSCETRDSLAKGIVTAVRTLIAEDQQRWRPDWAKSCDKVLGLHIGDIWIQPKHEPSSWTSAESAAVGNDVNRIQATISGKESHLTQYHGECGNVWLLIVAEIHLSTYFSPDEDFDGAIFRTDFDRVFILDVFRNQVRELSLQRI